MAGRQMPRGTPPAILFGMHSRRTATALAILLAASFATAGLIASGAAPAQATGGGVPRCGGGTVLLDAKEKATFSLHNKIRRDRNLGAFCVHPKLQKAARSHSRDMIERDYFSHDTKGGKTFDAPEGLWLRPRRLPLLRDGREHRLRQRTVRRTWQQDGRVDEERRPPAQHPQR